MDCNREWRAVVGFEGYYEVSNDGHVRSVDRIVGRRDGGQEKRRGKPLKMILDAYGYHVVNLVADGYRERRKVHDLVLRAFVGKRPSGCYGTNHLNADRADNRVENLEWCDHSRNMQHMADLGRDNGPRGERHHMAKLKEWQVRCIRRGRDLGWTTREMADCLGVNCETIRLAAKGQSYASII